MKLDKAINKISKEMDPKNWTLIEHIKFWIIRKLERIINK